MLASANTACPLKTSCYKLSLSPTFPWKIRSNNLSPKEETQTLTFSPFNLLTQNSDTKCGDVCGDELSPVGQLGLLDQVYFVTSCMPPLNFYGAGGGGCLFQQQRERERERKKERRKKKEKKERKKEKESKKKNEKRSVNRFSVVQSESLQSVVARCRGPGDQYPASVIQSQGVHLFTSARRDRCLIRQLQQALWDVVCSALFPEGQVGRWFCSGWKSLNSCFPIFFRKDTKDPGSFSADTGASA